MSAQDEIPRINMRNSDKILVSQNSATYRAALEAAARKLREDSRFLGAIRLREHTAELGALQALTNQSRSIGKAAIERMSPENVALYQDGLEAATAAAKAVIEKMTSAA